MVPGARLLETLRPVLARAWSRDSTGVSSVEEMPLRSELFSAEQMEQHGRRLAGSHALARDRSPDPLLPRLAANDEILARVFEQLTRAVAAGRYVTPASEWLVDNYYLLEEQN